MHLGEDELLGAIGKILSGTGPEVRIGPGDDAAVLAPMGGDLVLTTDALVEGVHFDRSLISARDLGYKAVVVNVSDAAAMGASPRAALAALVLPPAVDEPWTIELFGGMREACDEHALWLVGGDLSRGDQIVIAITVTGEVASGRAIARSGARPGDVIVVTGVLGASAAGLRLARTGRIRGEADRELLRAHMRPIARVGEGALLARGGATAMMDVSDGLGRDLRRLVTAGGVGARVRIGEVPVADGATREEALGGGEDYELLATLSPDDVAGVALALRETYGTPLTPIGEIVAGAGVTAVDAGHEEPLAPTGWDHFGG